MARLDAALRTSEDSAREQETLLANARQQIAAEETTLQREQKAIDELGSELSGSRLKLAELDGRIAILAETDSHAAAELSAAEVAKRGAASQRADGGRGVATGRAAPGSVAEPSPGGQKRSSSKQMRQAGRLQNDAVSYKVQLDNLAQERARRQRKSEQAAENLASLDLELRS